MSSKIEFAVEMTCEKCVNVIREKLNNVAGVHQVEISLEKGSVVVDTSLPSSRVQQLIESTNRRAILKGYGEEKKSAAVAMLGGSIGSGLGPVKGVVRFLQLSPDSCIIDGTIDGLTPGFHGLHVHECGDISKGCESVGSHFNPYNTKHGGQGNDVQSRHAGDLGNVEADQTGRASFVLKDKVLKVPDIIGRSIVVTEKKDDLGQGDSIHSSVDGNSGTRLACGIIARSAGIFENVKKICACDGVTLWEERDKLTQEEAKQEKCSL